MNIAVLSQIAVVSGNTSTSEAVQEARDAGRKQKFSGLYESAYYLAAQNPQEFFVMSMWYSLNDIPDFKAVWNNEHGRPVAAKTRLVNRQTFQLVKEFKLTSRPTQVSAIRVVTFSGVSQNAAIRATLRLIEERVKHPGLVGIWLGVKLDEAAGTVTILRRGDWDSIESRDAFYESEGLHQMLEEDRQQGHIGDYASSDLAGIMRGDQFSGE